MLHHALKLIDTESMFCTFSATMEAANAAQVFYITSLPAAFREGLSKFLIITLTLS